MKKYFIFAAIATAGLFASCSSSDDVISNAGNGIENEDQQVPIQIGVGNTATLDLTRGTGTVGGVGTGANAWHGQKINVFMFTKDANKATTLNLTAETDAQQQSSEMYNNQPMLTPGHGENTYPNSAATDYGEATIDGGDIKYYPAAGNFDFFGYHGDDATGAVNSTDDNIWTVPFTIDGSQDLMSTKAELTAGQTALLTAPGDFYSAKAARKGVQPILQFKHLLTRLSFVLVAGNDNAVGVTSTTDVKTKAEYDALADKTGYEIIAYTAKATVSTTDWGNITGDEKNTYWEADDPTNITEYVKKASAPNLSVTEWTNLANANLKAQFEPIYAKTTLNPQDPQYAVKVTKIEVTSKNSGNLAVAWTAAGQLNNAVVSETNKIAWADDTEDLVLKDRLYANKTDANSTITGADVTEYATEYATASDTRKAAIDAEIATWAKAKISEASWNRLNANGQGKYTAVDDPINENLIELTPTAPGYDGTQTGNARFVETPVGESLIIAPTDQDITVKVTLSQLVKTNWDGTEEVKTPEPLTLTIPKLLTANSKFEQNTSYKIKLTVYGLERIIINAKIEPWTEGETITVDPDA